MRGIEQQVSHAVSLHVDIPSGVQSVSVEDVVRTALSFISMGNEYNGQYICLALIGMHYASARLVSEICPAGNSSFDVHAIATRWHCGVPC